MNTQTKNITLQYALLQATFWMAFAAISAFSSVYLLSLGISNSVIGLTLSLGALVSVFLQPLTGTLIDTSERITTKKVLLVSSVMMLAAAILMYPVSKGVPVLVPLLYGCLICLLQLQLPFTNSIAMESINGGFKLNFGPARAVGSIGYALSSLVMGKAAEALGGGVVQVFIVVGFVLVLLILLSFPAVAKAEKAVTEEKTEGDKEGLFTFLSKYDGFLIILVGLTMIYFSHMSINTFCLQVIIPRGGNSEALGIATAIAATVELIPMVIFPFLSKNVKMSILLRISGVFFSLKAIGTFLAANMTTFYLVQLCQTFAWGIMAVTLVYYVNELMDQHDKARGQAFAGMTYTISCVVSSLIGGTIIDHFGVDTLLIIGSAVSVIGTVILWTGLGKAEKSHS